MRSKSMQSLTDDVKQDHPGVVIYGVGDDDHRLRTSDHNEDDTAGSKAAQSDADSIPEHRAIDVMLGPAFTKAEAYALIAYILARPDLRKRLIYIIFDGWIWSKSHGWVKREFDGDPHDDHIHFSGDAADDNNDAPWLEDDMEQSEKLARLTSNPNRTVGDLLYDLSNLRDWLYAVPGGKVVNPPPAGSHADLLVQAARRPAAVVDVDEAALAAALAPLLETGATPAEVAAAVRAEIDKTRLVGG